MRLIRWLVLGCISLGAATLAQAQNTEGELASRLVDKPLILRGFWRDDKLALDAQGNPQKAYKTASFTVCGMNVQTVSLHGKHLHLEGVREAIVFDKDGNMSRIPLLEAKGFLPNATRPEKLIIDIDNGPSKDFQPALDAVFSSNISQLAPSLPDFWQSYIAQNFDANGNPVVSRKSAERALKPGVMKIGGVVKPPKLLHSVDPEFSEDARRRKYSGSVQVYLIVDATGTPTEVSLQKAAGTGLDEKAIAAVKQYKFSPATQDGQPVSVGLSIDVNFQIF